MAKIPTKPDAVPFQLRPGLPPFGPAGWRGMNTEFDPGSLGPNELQYGEDVRLTGKSIRTRSGYELALDLSTAAGSIYHFGALPVDNPRTRLWLTALAVFDPTPSALQTGSSVYHIDPSENPVFQTHSRFYSEAGSIALLAKFGTKLYIGERETLKELIDIPAPPGLDPIDISPTAAALAVVRFPSYTIRALKEFDGKLFIALDNDLDHTNSKIMIYDGLDIADDLTGVGPCYAFGTWRDKLVAGFDQDSGYIKVRDAGSAPGVWATYSATDFGTTQAGNAIIEYGPNTFIATGRESIYSFGGTALSLAHTISSCHTTFLSGCNALTLHNGLLYYGWGDAATEDARIGRYDRDSSATDWIDIYKDVSADQPNFKRLTAMKSYRGQIYCGGLQMWVVRTALNDVQGLVEAVNDTGEVDTGDPTRDFRVVGFLRYP